MHTDYRQTCPWSVFLTLYARGQQRCGLWLPVLWQLVIPVTVWYVFVYIGPNCRTWATIVLSVLLKWWSVFFVTYCWRITRNCVSQIFSQTFSATGDQESTELLETLKRTSQTQCPGTSAGVWLGDQCPLAAWGEENLTTKWCILKYVRINMWSA